MDRLAKALGVKFCNVCGDEIVIHEAGEANRMYTHIVHEEKSAIFPSGFWYTSFAGINTEDKHIAMTREEYEQ